MCARTLPGTPTPKSGLREGTLTCGDSSSHQTDDPATWSRELMSRAKVSLLDVLPMVGGWYWQPHINGFQDGRRALNALCSQGWPWPSHPPASIFRCQHGHRAQLFFSLSETGSQDENSQWPTRFYLLSIGRKGGHRASPGPFLYVVQETESSGLCVLSNTPLIEPRLQPPNCIKRLQIHGSYLMRALLLVFNGS
ncbi:rCG54511 [Rattus norvegicus]|uniref:RCG54511 n=1 Tax=Rattus norvegicus TaxID=10116 RepID=A6J9L0_RAT|nr:rCG54511 [Rattus norvegicus]